MQSAVFHCPYDGCPYHRDSVPAKSFKKQLFADQHVANKHQEKQFHCSVCDKRYSFAWQLKHHKEVCGLIWSCLSCDKTYSERLSLVVHCKRHKHILPEEARGWAGRKKRKQPVSTTIVLVPVLIGVPVAAAPVAQDRVILPKAPLIPAATQTHDNAESVKELLFRRKKSESQTGTQTEKKKQSKSAQCPPIRRRISANRKRGQQLTESTETQTTESILSAISIATALCPTDESSTRTASTNVGTVRRNVPVISNTSSLSPFTGSEIPLENILFTETSVQTDEQLSAVMPCSTIETQTCNSEYMSFGGQFETEDLFFELDVNDIETQTIWNSDETTQTDAVMDDLMLGFELLSDAE